MFFGGSKSPKASPASPAQTMPAAGAREIIFDVNTPDFEERVMLASMHTPVIVDFWAPWCGPCKQLMPALEKVVRETGGKVLLAKVNIDNNQELAGMLRIQAVPTVYAFFQGQPVDGFQSVQPESKLKAFIEKLVTLARSAQPDALDIPEALKGAATALAENDLATAQAIYAQILQQDAQNAAAFVGMVRVFIAADQIDHAQNMIDNAPEEIAKSSVFAEAKNALDIARRGPSTPIDALKAKIVADPNDHAARIDLAYALFAAGQKEDATNALLDSIALDREWNDQAARTELLTLFSAMGQADPVTIAARRKLSSILFS